MEPVFDRRESEQFVRRQMAIDRVASLRPRWLKEPHDKGQIQFLQSRHKIRVAIPGNGWGKTSIMAMALDMAIQRDDPFTSELLPKWPVVAVWVCQKFQQMDILKHQLENEVWTRPWSWNQSRHFYRWPNGSELHIVSADSDWLHVQGIAVDFVCFDEHPDRKLWNELLFRRRGLKKTRYMVAATMTQGVTWFVKEIVQDWENFHKKLGMTGEQARQQQLHPNVWVWDKGGLRDNPSMNEDDFRHYEGIGHASGKEIRVRLTGGYADFAGESVFDQPSLDRQMPSLSDGTQGSLHLIDASEAQLVLPKEFEHTDTEKVLKRRLAGTGGTRYAQWVAEGVIEGGRMTVWEPPDMRATYVMGADFAAGLTGRDYDACVIMKKREDGIVEQVAELRGWWGDGMFAELLYLAGSWYYNAFLVGERQFGLPALRRLYDEWKYPFIYRGRNEAVRARKPSELLGHHRSSGDTIIPNLRNALVKDHIIIRSPDLMTELRQYQFRARSSMVDMETATSDQLTTGAPAGLNDDLVLALAYAWHAAREAGRFTMPIPEYAHGTYGEVFQNARILNGKKVKEGRPWWLG